MIDPRADPERADRQPGAAVVVQRADLHQLFDALRAQGYQILGPTIRDGAIVYDELATVEDLPIGWTDVQEGGTYRIKRRADAALFGYNVGPHSWKRYLHPPVLRLWGARREPGQGWQIVDAPEDTLPRRAFLGVRACELHAIGIQDRVFLGGSYVDPAYQARRAGVFMIAVNCGQAAATCFCTSMGTGPGVPPGYDLALTEVLDATHHYFVVDIGTAAGAEVMGAVTCVPAQAAERETAAQIVATTAAQMGRTLDTTGIKELLYANLEHPRWDDVASRCLSCGNCTQVCPTCFCTSVEDVTDLAGQEATRTRTWDSCFTTDFSYIHGGAVRPSPKARYRQWMTHKLATWIDQFDTSGCVGCGRCITWCPVGIDLTAEVRAIRATPASPPPTPGGTP
ncbi:MAG TPA: 4Fe-4S dicluster domain-containing protein [Chloroflexia bacterium]|nr:4Fe-4S dicluster domain-containing protein [Chloroflexia bacterium]